MKDKAHARGTLFGKNQMIDEGKEDVLPLMRRTERPRDCVRWAWTYEENHILVCTGNRLSEELGTLILRSDILKILNAWG